MRALEAGQRAHALSCLRVDNLYAGPVRHVDNVRRGIGKQVIPSSFAADLPVIDNFKLAGGRFGRESIRGQKRQAGRGCQRGNGILQIHRTSSRIPPQFPIPILKTT